MPKNIDEKELENFKPTFTIDNRPRLIELPPFEEREKINIRYPLIAPYAYAHIFWDKENNELKYHIEEPILDNTEKEILRMIQLALEEMINISYIRAVKSKMIFKYLEKNVQNILIELGIKVSRETYNKIMYYVYRNSIGLDEIEPLMNDYYIEDIECNGVNIPVYVVHRKYENMSTNIKFDTHQKLTNFVEKLSQKSGRYISYAKPILDGTLPDGSRVNATYTTDITTRGPTFTIRKFTKEPWTPIHLIKFNTASPEMFAFLWIAIEHKANIMIIGETASGKTTFLNSIAHFIPGESRICSIEDTRELNLIHENWLPSVTRSGFGMPTFFGKTIGEIDLFDLLKETFRQNPDYVILGETRGKETYVLFQGMASGHPSLSTFHAASVESMVRRLETPPISLPASLVESLDIVCTITHIKDQERNIRRIKQVNEIISVEQQMGKVNMNKLFEWVIPKDEFVFRGNSYIFKKISTYEGIPESKLMNELRRRAALLRKMAEQNIVNFKDVAPIISRYYKNPEEILTKFGIKL